MPFVKGQSGNPNGRKPGPTRATREFRETVTKVLEENSENVGIWLSEVANGKEDVKADPGKALDLLAKLAEYASPKLARTESHVTPGSEKSHEEWLNELE